MGFGYRLFGKVPVWCVAERKQQPVDKTAEQEEAMALQKPMPGTARRGEPTGYGEEARTACGAN